VAGDVTTTGRAGADVTSPRERQDLPASGDNGEVTQGAAPPGPAAPAPAAPPAAAAPEVSPEPAAPAAPAPPPTPPPGTGGGAAVRWRLARLGAPRGGGVNPVLEPLAKTVRATHPKADIRLI
jgi:GTP diphosphokinase / guanosine-3',5'-bis(diphosphate) 3'-diphosphatase